MVPRFFFENFKNVLCIFDFVCRVYITSIDCKPNFLLLRISLTVKFLEKIDIVCHIIGARD